MKDLYYVMKFSFFPREKKRNRDLRSNSKSLIISVYYFTIKIILRFIYLNLIN